MTRVAEMHVCAACALRAQLRVHCGSSTAFALAEVRYLDAALRGCDAIGAARPVGGWLGLDGGLVEQDRLRRKGPGGVRGEALRRGLGEARCVGL